uniref:Uncharacterized protein n=1 Tax=Stegastes partitus TaxID=144197 RepID=A0A3B4ZZF7_9TELE
MSYSACVGASGVKGPSLPVCVCVCVTRRVRRVGVRHVSVCRAGMPALMDWKSGGAMEVAALGRPFSLRMLYDCRKDSLIPGKTLHIKQIEYSDSPQNEIDSTFSQSESAGHHLLLKPLVPSSPLGQGTKGSRASERRTMRRLVHKQSCFKVSSLSDRKPMQRLEHWTNIAFFVFDCEVSEKEDHQDIQGNLKGKGSLKMEDKDKENVDKFSCRFFGDFCLQKTPTSFQDAVKVYQIQEAQTVLEDFSELEMRCNDALRTTTALQFPQIGKKIKSLKEMCSKFKLEFQQTLAKKLPSIRGGGEEESELAEILKKTNSSPFSREHLDEWMDCKEREISILKSFNKMMKNTKTVPSQNDLDEELVRAEHAVCFVFTSLGSDESYLSALSNYLKGTTKPEELQDPHTCNVEKEQRYLSKETTDDMRKKAKRFSDFSETNTENKNTKFLMVGLTNETQKGSSIYLYKDGISYKRHKKRQTDHRATM